jgi:hypothetical protein
MDPRFVKLRKDLESAVQGMSSEELSGHQQHSAMRGSGAEYSAQE